MIYFSIMAVVISLFVLIYLLLKPVETWPIPAQELGFNKDLCILRGKYLVENVAHCAHCHSPTDSTKFGFPVLEGRKYSGGFLMGHNQGLPAELYAANLTPYGLSKYQDDDLYRALTQGVAKDGHVMFPLMPYGAYSKMDPQDVWSMIAYLRTLPSIRNDVPTSTVDFPVGLINKLSQPSPQPTSFASLSQEADLGAYYANIAGCLECHSPENSRHEADLSQAGAGGRAFVLPGGGVVRSSNITREPRTGIGSWSADRFVSRFKQYADTAYRPETIPAGGANTYMAWHFFAGMEEADLRRIYAYLRTLPPQSNQVVRYSPASN